MSAQSRDETTIPIAENLFKKYKTLKELSKANYNDVLIIFKSSFILSPLIIKISNIILI